MMTDTTNLFRMAKKTEKNSRSPYSLFRVGAAILTDEGSIFTGTNIENASFGLTICAERVAIFNAISNGYNSFTDLAITSHSDLPTSSHSDLPTFPCGACRQVLYELSPEIRIHIEGSNTVFQIKDLLPYPFDAKQLTK